MTKVVHAVVAHPPESNSWLVDVYDDLEEANKHAKHIEESSDQSEYGAAVITTTLSSKFEPDGVDY